MGLYSKYYAYADFLKDRFGCRVSKVTVDAGFSCPNRDGTLSAQGCVFCNNDAFSPARRRASLPLADQITGGIERQKTAGRTQKFIVYFQPFTNTYKPAGALEKIYRAAFCHPDVAGIAVGTRPDAVDSEKISLLADIARDSYVSLEYGVQSVYDETLRRINRGHTFEALQKAVEMTRGTGIDICFHVILGFPWEDQGHVRRAAGILSDLGYQSLKLHNLHVLRDTPLAEDFARGKMSLPGLAEYTGLAVDFLERTPGNIAVQRLAGEAPRQYLVAPGWCQDKASVLAAVNREFEKRGTAQGVHTARPYQTA